MLLQDFYKIITSETPFGYWRHLLGITCLVVDWNQLYSFDWGATLHVWKQNRETEKKNLHVLLLFSHSVLPNSLRPQALQHARLPCPSPSPGVCSNSCPFNQWCHPTISSSVSPSPPAFNLSHHQGFFSNESALSIRWPKYWSFNSSLPMNIQSWFPLGLTGWVSFQSKGLSRIFSNTTASILWTQPSLWSNSHLHKWQLEKP